MADCLYGFVDVAMVQGVLRRKLNERQVDWNAAWHEAAAAFDGMFGTTEDKIGCPPGHCVDSGGNLRKITAPKPKVKELDLPPHIPCSDHRVKSFTFSDGVTWECCTADGCLYGKGRKSHSDGEKYHEPFLPEEEAEQSVCELDELQVVATEQIRIAGEDEPDEESESDEESEIGLEEAEHDA